MFIITVSLFNKVALAVALLLILAYFAYKRIKVSIKFSLDDLSVPLVTILVPIMLSSFYLLPLISTSGNAFSGESKDTVLSGWDTSQSADIATLFIFSRVSKFIGYFGVPFFLFLLLIPVLLRNMDKDCVRVPFILFVTSFAIGISFRIIPVLLGLPLPYRLWAIGSEFLKMSLPFFLFNVAFLLNEKVKKKQFVAIFVLLAILPTFAHGYLRTLDKVPYGDGPIYISDSEMQAFEWINKNTMPQDVFVVRLMTIVGHLGSGGMRLQPSPPLVPYTGRSVVIGSDVFSSVYSFESPPRYHKRWLM